jgi:hypothetical protein
VLVAVWLADLVLVSGRVSCGWQAEGLFGPVLVGWIRRHTVIWSATTANGYLPAQPRGSAASAEHTIRVPRGPQLAAA